jgi:hypothetical protein
MVPVVLLVLSKVGACSGRECRCFNGITWMHDCTRCMHGMRIRFARKSVMRFDDAEASPEHSKLLWHRHHSRSLSQAHGALV